MDNLGNFYLSGVNGKLEWISSTSSLEIKGDIVGSKIYGPNKNSAYIEIGSDASGYSDFKIFRAGQAQPSFDILDIGISLYLQARKSSASFLDTFLITDGNLTEPHGNWDFSFSNVTGGSWDFTNMDLSGTMTFGSVNVTGGVKKIYIQSTSSGIPTDGSAIWIDTSV
jgi:hypothetical protein